MQNFWDEMFAGEDFRYGTEPNAFLQAQAATAFPATGKILSLGEGEGRNAVWLARQGFAVTAVDQSAVGQAKMARLAEHFGVRVEAILGSAADAHVPEGSFDGVVLCYLHAPPGVRAIIHTQAMRALKPGGAVVLEGFHPDQRRLERTSGGPRDETMLFTEDMLRKDFAAMAWEYLASEEVDLAEGPGHAGRANVVRMVARKPLGAPSGLGAS